MHTPTRSSAPDPALGKAMAEIFQWATRHGFRPEEAAALAAGRRKLSITPISNADASLIDRLFDQELTRRRAAGEAPLRPRWL